MKKTLLLILIFIIGASACKFSNTKNEIAENDAHTGETKKSQVEYPEEKHFKNIRQLTWGGDNAEAYWSFNDSMLVFQATNKEWGANCDQIYYTKRTVDNLGKVKPKMISTGKGRTTCAYFLPGDTTIVYASTHLSGDDCPPVPEKREDGKYVWPVYKSFDIFVADLNGNIINQLTTNPGYDAEATVSPLGDKIVFTSMRTGDLELFTMNLDGTDVTQLTFELGYDGGAFFSHDGTKLVFRSSRPKSEEEIKEYKNLLAEGLVTPTNMEIYICNVEGSDLKKITNLGGANWSPFFHPSDQKIIFSSNHASEKGFPFNLYMINIDGSALEKISYDGVFDAFPVFSYDGIHLIFSSNRNNNGTHDTNLFMAEWVD